MNLSPLCVPFSREGRNEQGFTLTLALKGEREKESKRHAKYNNESRLDIGNENWEKKGSLDKRERERERARERE